MLLWWLAHFPVDDPHARIFEAIDQLNAGLMIWEGEATRAIFKETWLNYGYVVLDTFAHAVCIELAILPPGSDSSLAGTHHREVSVENVCATFFEVSGIDDIVEHRAAFLAFFVDFCIREAGRGGPVPFSVDLRCAPVELAFFLLRSALYCPECGPEFARVPPGKRISWHGFERTANLLWWASEDLFCVYDERIAATSVDVVLAGLDRKRKSSLNYFCALLGRPGEQWELVECLCPRP
jgi:hypothetical protein